jgi:Secretion system C-terminal sorting domain/NHL repeat
MLFFGAETADDYQVTTISVQSLLQNRHQCIINSIFDLYNIRMRPIICLLFLFPLFANAQIITTIAGNGTGGSTGDGGPATSALVFSPYGICMDRSQNIYFADFGNHRVRGIDASGVIHGDAGTGASGYGGDGGPATAALFSYVYGVATDTAESIYVCDYVNMRVRKFIVGGSIITIAGNGMAGYSGDGGPATAAELYSPAGITFDKRQNIYIADRGNYRIRKVDPSGIITTIAGDGTSGYSGDGGPATNAKLNFPNMMATDAAGNLYFTDPGNYRVRKVDTSGIITTIAGIGVAGYSGDGLAASTALINWPEGITIDGCGNIYFDDGLNYRIRKINTAGIVSTVAGIGSLGYTGDGGSPLLARISEARGLAADKYGNIIIAGSNGNNIRKIFIAAHPPAFTEGHSQSIAVCMDSLRNIDTVLAISDLDTAKTVTWRVLSAPAHGTLVAAYQTTTTGAVIIPPGLSYTPVTGYIGNDSFKVQVADCGNLFDTTTVYVTVVACGTLDTKATAGTEIKTDVYPNPVTKVLTVTSTEMMRTITITNLAGETVYTHSYNAIRVQIDMANQPAGVYFVKVNGTAVKRFVKE